jgi:PAS domain-containing protein
LPQWRILKSGRTSDEQYRQMWQTIIAGNVWRGEFCNRKKNGELFWESAVICPVRDENGNISHFLAVKEDITERRQAEKDLQLTRFSLESASDSVFWVDPQARILYANEAACSTLARSRQELASLSIPDIDPLFPRVKMARLLARAQNAPLDEFRNPAETQGRPCLSD